MLRCNAKKSAGFTLIEILIVVIILGILAGIVIPQFANATTSSKTGSVQTTAQNAVRSDRAALLLPAQRHLAAGGQFLDADDVADGRLGCGVQQRHVDNRPIWPLCPIDTGQRTKPVDERSGRQHTAGGPDDQLLRMGLRLQ